MSAINIKIQKKDLWLISAIMVFLVGVGYVIAYNSGGPPSIMGHSAEEIEGGSGVNSYDSGWFAVSDAGPAGSTTYTKNHNLGTINIITEILFAPDSGGAPDLSRVYKVDYHLSWGGHSEGGLIRNITNTDLTVSIPGSVFRFGGWTSGWYKVIAISID